MVRSGQWSPLRPGVQRNVIQLAISQKAGQITAAGIKRDVTFGPAETPLAPQIDAAYQATYRSSPYLSSMIANRAQSGNGTYPAGNKVA